MQPEVSAYREKGLDIVVVTADSRAAMERAYKDFSELYITAADTGRAITLQYGIQGYPTSFLIDRQGRIIARSMGWSASRSLEEWKAKADRALAE